MTNVDMPLVSIITPAYNSAKYIEETLNCIKNQSYKNIEHIIVDGNSSDNTLEIIKQFKNVNWISEQDKGMYDAINKGISLSKGEIIAFLNSDDLYFSYTIEIIVDEYLKTENDVFIGYCCFINHNSEIMFSYRYPFIKMDIPRKLGRMPFCQQSVFWTRRRLNEIGGFNASYRYSGDFDFFIRLLNTKNISSIRKVIASFRLHESQLSQNTKEHWQEHLLIMNKNGIKVGYNLFRLYYEFLFKLYNVKSIIIRILKGY